MMRAALALFAALIPAGLLRAAEGDVVFRSDVALVRVDAQVVDRGNRAITGLRAEDFVLREEGRPQQIRNFASENMPVDVLLLLDVSTSMRPHVERVAGAARQALRVLGGDDRLGIMVFDRSARVRMPFRNSREDIQQGFESVLRQENFNGGTDITRGLLEAAKYIERNGRRDARRAILILTDDQTERDRDEERVSRALTAADAVLMALLAPDAMGQLSRRRSGGTWPGGGGGGGGWPRAGGPLDPLGGIILGRRGPYGGRGGGPVTIGGHTQSAGTADIARRSGGDSASVDDPSAFEDALARIRQRYALHFHLPEGVRPGQERQIEVELADAARRRYPDAEVRYRRVYMTPGSGAGDTQPTVVSGTPAAAPPAEQQQGGWRRAEPAQADSSQEPAPRQGGWRRVKPGEEP